MRRFFVSLIVGLMCVGAAMAAGKGKSKSVDDVRAAQRDSVMYELMREQDFVKIKTVATLYIAEDSTDIRHYMVRGFAQSMLGEYDEALADYNKAIDMYNAKVGKKYDITLSDIYTTRAELYRAKGENLAANYDYQSALKLDKKNARANKEYGIFIYNLRAYDSALPYLKAAIDLDPDDKESWDYYMRTLLGLGQYDEVRNMAQEFREKDFYCPRFHFIFAYTFRYKEEWRPYIDEMLVYYAETEDLDFSHLEAAIPYEPEHLIDMVSYCIEHAESIREKNYFLSMRIDINKKLGQYDKCLEDLNTIEAIASEAGYISPYVNETRMRVCFDKEDYVATILYASADIEFREQQNENPDIPYYYRACASFYIGDTIRAISDLNKVLENIPDDASLWFLRGRIKETMRDFNGAVADYTRSIELDPSVAQPYASRGCVEYLALGDTARAMTDFGMVMSRDSAHGDFSKKALVLACLGRHSEVRDCIFRSIARNVDDQIAYLDAVCASAIIGDADAAMMFLRIYFEKGGRQFFLIDNNYMFDSLRNRNDFKALVSDYRRRSLKQR